MTLRTKIEQAKPMVTGFYVGKGGEHIFTVPLIDLPSNKENNENI